MYRLMYVPVFAHLWFLWLFSWLVVGFAIIAMIVERLPAIKLPSVLVLSPARYVWLIPLTMIPQSFMGFQGRIPSVGPDTSQGILPMPHVLAYYALFFGFGALYASYDDKVGRISKRWRFALPIGLLVIFPLGLEFSTGAFGLRDKLLADELHRLLSIFFQAIYPWTLTFALMGLIRHFFSKASKTMRYLSDSSYWMYLTHMPLVTAAQIAVCEWPMPAIIKFTLIFVVICAFLLWTYQTLVRYTWLGTFLNGPRKRPVKTVAQGELVKRRA